MQIHLEWDDKQNILFLYGEYAEFFSLSTRIWDDRRKVSA
jgi:hypothetical protein